uniref:Uncharacterized protein n=1 Tax=Micrurus surinamensis TaxID=129470 RepID=A0A2D4P9H3_MICSU
MQASEKSECKYISVTTHKIKQGGHTQIQKPLHAAYAFLQSSSQFGKKASPCVKTQQSFQGSVHSVFWSRICIVLQRRKALLFLKYVPGISAKGPDIIFMLFHSIFYLIRSIKIGLFLALLTNFPID